ncbi:hypothetical protein D3C86_2211150 [compost metagenome]
MQLRLPLLQFQIFLLNIRDIHIINQALDLHGHSVEFPYQLADFILRFRFINEIEMLIFHLFHMNKNAN